MLPAADVGVRQPVRRARRVPAGPDRARRRPRRDRRTARRRAGRGGPDLGGHRGGRPGRPRWVGGRGRRLVARRRTAGGGVRGDGAPRRAAGVPVAGRAGTAPSCARCASGPTAGSTSTPWPRRAGPTWAWCRSWPSTTRSAPSSPSTKWRPIVADGSPGAVLHTDAVQAVPWLDVATRTRAGRTGVGQRPQVRRAEGERRAGRAVGRLGCRPRIGGGGQERGRRSGTPNVAGAVGDGRRTGADGGRRATPPSPGWAACGTGSATVWRRRCPVRVETGDRADRVAGILHLRVGGVEAEAAVVAARPRPASPRRPGRPARAGRSSRATCWWPWASTRSEASSGLRFSLGVTTTERGCRAVRWPGFPTSLDRLRD